MTNSSSRTPNSATERIDSGSVKILQAERADGEPGHEIADDRAEPDPLEDRYGDNRRAEKRDRGDQFGAVGIGFHAQL